MPRVKTQMKGKALFVAALCLAATPAFAGEPCRSAKDLVNVAQNFYGDNPELTNIITPEVELVLEGINGSETPTAMLYRYQGEEHSLPVVDGRLLELEKAVSWSKKGEICRVVNGELAPATEDNSTSVRTSFSFPYKRSDGVFTVDEIKEGAKDGTKAMRSLAPGGLGFVMPSLKTIALGHAEDGGPKPTFEFLRKGKPVTVQSSPIGEETLFRIKDIKSSKADMMSITGQYILSADLQI